LASQRDTSKKGKVKRYIEVEPDPYEDLPFLKGHIESWADEPVEIDEWKSDRDSCLTTMSRPFTWEGLTTLPFPETVLAATDENTLKLAVNQMLRGQNFSSVLKMAYWVVHNYRTIKVLQSRQPLSGAFIILRTMLQKAVTQCGGKRISILVRTNASSVKRIHKSSSIASTYTFTIAMDNGPTFEAKMAKSVETPTDAFFFWLQSKLHVDLFLSIWMLKRGRLNYAAKVPLTNVVPFPVVKSRWEKPGLRKFYESVISKPKILVTKIRDGVLEVTTLVHYATRQTEGLTPIDPLRPEFSLRETRGEVAFPYSSLTVQYSRETVNRFRLNLDFQADRRFLSCYMVFGTPKQQFLEMLRKEAKAIMALKAELALQRMLTKQRVADQKYNRSHNVARKQGGGKKANAKFVQYEDHSHDLGHADQDEDEYDRLEREEDEREQREFHRQTAILRRLDAEEEEAMYGGSASADTDYALVDDQPSDW
jgi:hypothetical protein